MPDEKSKEARLEAKDSAFKTELLKEHSIPSAVLGLDLFPDNKRAVLACLDGSILELDLESGASTPLGRHESYASSVSLLPSSEGQRAISAGYDGKLIWHDLASKKST